MKGFVAVALLLLPVALQGCSRSGEGGPSYFLINASDVLVVFRQSRPGLTTVNGAGDTATLDRQGRCLTLRIKSGVKTPVFPTQPIVTAEGLNVGGRAMSFGITYALENVEAGLTVPAEIKRQLAQAGCPPEFLYFSSSARSRTDLN